MGKGRKRIAAQENELVGGQSYWCANGAPTFISECFELDA
jgi:hypothetical protein